jgi:hypothetical protein
MCGATDEQKNLQAEQAQFYSEMTKSYKEKYANQAGIYGKLSAVFDPILAKGPSQKGFSDEESNNLNAQAVEGTAENYQQAARAVNEHLATLGGGDLPMPTGGEIQLKSQVANSAAREQSQEQNKILADDYATGRNNFEQATAGEEAIAAGEDPTAYANSATGAGNAASNTANEVAQENNSWINAALGAAGSIGTAVASENPGNIFG